MLPVNATLRSQVSRLALEIHALQTNLAEMQAELVRLQHQLDAVTYPVLSLPPEIVSGIFLHCLPAEALGTDGIDNTEAPLLVSHVCSQWRRIALSTPALWANLDIDVSCRNLYAAEIAKAWLGRARSSPLSVKIQGQITELGDSAQFFETLRRHAPGIKSLEISVYVDDLARLPQDIDFSLLRDLNIRLIHDDEFPDVFEAFSGAQALSQIVLNQMSPSFIALPWQQLQKFTGKSYTIPQCIEVLSLMPNLTECAFSVFSLGSLAIPGVFSHSGIRTFTLFRSSSDWGQEADSAEILEFVTFPNLESFELLDVDSKDGEALDSFFQRYRQPLKRLIIRPLDATQLVMTSEPLWQPQLTELEIWYPETLFARIFFENLGEQPDYVSGLQKLTFYCRRDPSEERHEELVARAAEAIVSRGKLESEAQLRVFHAFSIPSNYLAPPPRSALATFRRLAEEGMDIYIGTEDGRNNYINMKDYTQE
ncbi:hypothetical protein FB45DRAFT_905292 [Roridomyces roridus]|uniref:F-box domain-containing protein n=1 Tax=Roridomyces roridus TaxID=1738132 RepID=A0AAD7FV35_9AGAR|nr:hypothetical protein FB45DRAFT_905292 [Roridomyces roridus]